MSQDLVCDLLVTGALPGVTLNTVALFPLNITTNLHVNCHSSVSL